MIQCVGRTSAGNSTTQAPAFGEVLKLERWSNALGDRPTIVISLPEKRRVNAGNDSDRHAAEVVVLAAAHRDELARRETSAPHDVYRTLVPYDSGTSLPRDVGGVEDVVEMGRGGGE
jgi:hypothetical protein